MTYHSPKYWKEMARLRKEHEAWLQRQATSLKQASSSKLRKPQAASVKLQAASVKLKATSNKLHDHGPWKKFHGALTEVLY